MTLAVLAPEKENRHQLIRMLLPVGVFIGVSGFSTAIIAPYLSLFLIQNLRASPLQSSVFLFLVPLASVVLSTLLGYFSDRRSLRRPLLVFGALAGSITYVTYALVPNYWVLLAISITLVGFSSSGPPQTYAYAKELLDAEKSPRAPLAISTLRMLVSIAWVFGPPLAGFLLGVISFKGTYLASAAGFLLTATIALVWFRDAPETTRPEVPGSGTQKAAEADKLTITSRPVLLITLAFVLMQCSLTLSNLVLPLFVSHTLHAPIWKSGMVQGICAGLEIPLMLLFGALASRWPLRRLMVVGAGFGSSYFLMAGLAQHPWQLMAAQLLNACFISSVLGLGISYFQDLLPSAPGQATTLYSNTNRLAAMLAGPIFGIVLKLGYRSAYGVSLGMCLIGMALMAGVRVRSAALH